MEELKRRLLEISHLISVLNLLSWDQEVYMPKKGAESRASSIAELSSIIHEKSIKIDSDRLLTKLKKQVDAKKIRGKNAIIVLETWKKFERDRKLPKEFVREMAKTTSQSQRAWVEARKENDFALFLPWLTKVIKLKRREAEYVGYAKSPYDALIDTYEPGVDSEELSAVFSQLKDFLIPFLQKIHTSKVKIDEGIVKGHFPLAQQILFNEQVLNTLGFDFDAGRVDATTHPFAVNLHPHDVRITTRYKESDIFYSLFCVIHEAGHGMYEQGLPAEHFGNPLGEAISIGVHESQSRFWENMVGKSREFWTYLHPKLQREFPQPFRSISLQELYRSINKVEPTLIRTESDEVTYNLHIILRFEIEKGLIEGTIKPKDLPEIWKRKMKEYLGITVPTDALGVLQDVHWSAGLVGYFPTYTLGNIYSAQFFSKMNKDMSNMSKKIAQGDFAEIRKWLKKNIHSHGKTYTAKDLVKKVTGKDVDVVPFIEYISAKYRTIYPIE